MLPDFLPRKQPKVSCHPPCCVCGPTSKTVVLEILLHSGASAPPSLDSSCLPCFSQRDSTEVWINLDTADDRTNPFLIGQVGSFCSDVT